MSGAKRLPSSSVKKATAIGWRGGDAVLLERLDDLEPGEHAEVAVEAAAGARRCRCASRVITGAAVGSVPGRVATTLPMASIGDVEAEVAHPPDDEVAAGPVGVGEREAGAALLAVRALDRADLAELDEPRPQPVAVDAERRATSSSRSRPVVERGDLARARRRTRRPRRRTARRRARRSPPVGSPMWPSSAKSLDSQPNDTGPPKRT